MKNQTRNNLKEYISLSDKRTKDQKKEQDNGGRGVEVGGDSGAVQHHITVGYDGADTKGSDGSNEQGAQA